MELNPHLEIPLNEFVEKNMNLLHHLLNRKFKHLINAGRFEYDDLLNVAAIGMMKAYRQFDPTKFEKVTKFSTYGVPMIVGEVQRFTRDDNPGPRFPRRAKEIAWRIRQHDWYDESKEFIRDQINAEGLAAYQASPATIDNVTHAFEYLDNVYSRSMDEQIGISSDNSPITLLHQHGKEADYSSIMVEDFLSYLTPRQRQVIELTMEGMLSQYEIGKVVGISQVEVSRIIKRLRPKLTQYLQDGSMQKAKVRQTNKVVPIKEEVMDMAQGDRIKAINLLANTTLTYKDISRRTGVPEGTVGSLATKHRSKEVRNQLKADAGKKRMQSMLEAKAAKSSTKETIHGFDTKVVNESLHLFNEEPKKESSEAYKEVLPSVKKDVAPDEFIEHALANHQAIKEMMMFADKFADKKSEVKPLGDAIKDFQEEVIKEALAEKAPKGKITRRLTFNYDADGQDIAAEDFIEELEDLIEAIKSDTNRIVNFNISVNAS